MSSAFYKLSVNALLLSGVKKATEEIRGRATSLKVTNSKVCLMLCPLIKPVLTGR